MPTFSHPLQLNLAKAVPGKEEFNETLRYYKTMLEKHNVEVREMCIHSRSTV